MNLQTKYKVAASETNQVVFHLRFTLQLGEKRPHPIADNLLPRTLKSLADSWWVMREHDPRLDSNATLALAVGSDWETTTLNTLVEGSATFSSPDALALAAIVEGVKRAVDFAFQSFLFEQMFFALNQADAERFEVSSNRNMPSGHIGSPLPSLPQKVIDLAASY